MALPIAPLVLVVQAAALFAPSQRLRCSVAIASVVAIGAMLAYVSSLDIAPDEGVDLGTPLLALAFAASLALLAVAAAREAVSLVIRSSRRLPAIGRGRDEN